MIETITAVNQAVNQFIWGVPAMVCIIGVGLLLSVRTGFLQIRKFPYAIKTTIGRMFRKKDASDGAMTPFQAVCTALAGTVGTRQHCRCGRCHCHRRPGCRVLDVVLCPAGHVHQVCRGHAGGALP